ncbi:class I SAM-dependent methyltransferase [Halobacillus sp. HZG1]|uniref:SAM-dependent methyltransferase n=1 Tax=Halobacillus sp. HZG1 TaxID=3111769 RepID=UPI002DB66D0D|nr:class I SAM-dependent methyltransferase [Halobacillus sp. HZG1]MEC3884905.1 class I SAM-dependent methyltransferase [Halobacillus sp. HZG1]
MDSNKFSSVGHKNHSFYNPISPSKLDEVIKLLSLTEKDKVIDVGAGKGELLLRISENYNSHCTAIEQFGDFTEQLKENAKNRGVLNNITVIKEDANSALKTLDNEFNLGICIGSSHALGGYRNTIESLKKMVAKGGYILLGELYWRKKPDEEYLTEFGVEENEILYHPQNIFTAEEYALIPLWSTVANEDDFDAYEWLYSKSIEDYCYDNPEDPDCSAMLKRIRNWRTMYLKWGRETLGFGIYLFRNV